MTKKRLILFLALTFGLTWAIFGLWAGMGGSYLDTEGNVTSMGRLIAGLAMLCPTVGMLLTRWGTKEGFALRGSGSMLLGICMRQKKWRYYLLAMLLPWVYFELGNGLILLLAPEAASGAELKEMGTVLFLQPVAAIVNGTFVSFGALGEELGWRGYMMPKLMQLMDRRWALLVGGIIWGIWHWPMVCMGHNFGRSYWGYPVTGFAAMCVMTIAIGILLTVLVCKAESIWPAVILHAVNNGMPGILRYFIDVNRLPDWLNDSVVRFLLILLPAVLIAAACYMMFVREK